MSRASRAARRAEKHALVRGDSLDYKATPVVVRTEAAPPAILRAQIAPPANVERYPIILGSSLTMGVISAAMRLALTGLRMNFVDVVGELLDFEPDLLALITKRMTSLSGSRIEYLPADESPMARRLCDEFKLDIASFPDVPSVIERLAFSGILLGVGAEELIWSEKFLGSDERQRVIASMMIHSRRLSYPDWLQWELHIWDQGIGGGMASDASTYGIRISDYNPGKFIVHAPQLRAEYPTREGLARVLLGLMTIKRLILRVSAQEFEQFVRPWALAYYSTGEKPRTAVGEDVTAAQTVVRLLGSGNLRGAALPDSVRVELLKAASELSHLDFLRHIDSSMAKLVVGNAFNAEPGKHGSYGAHEQADADFLKISRADAAKLASTWQRDVVGAWVSINYPGQEAFAPRVVIHITESVSPLTLMQTAEIGARIGLPIDGAKLAERAGLPLLSPGQANAIRLVPVSAIDPDRLRDGVIAPPTQLSNHETSDLVRLPPVEMGKTR